MPQFDLISLASIALLALSAFVAYRNAGYRGMALGLLLLFMSLLQAAWRLQWLTPWGSLSVQMWTVVSAGMILAFALGLLHLERAEHTSGALWLIVLISFLQLIVSADIIR